MYIAMWDCYRFFVHGINKRVYIYTMILSTVLNKNTHVYTYMYKTCLNTAKEQSEYDGTEIIRCFSVDNCLVPERQGERWQGEKR